MVFKKGNIPWNLGVVFSLERRKEMSEVEKGEKNHFYGKHHTKETKLKISRAKSGENNYNYGKHLSEETKRKIGKRNKGKTVSKETRKKMSEARKGIPTWNKGIPCPYLKGSNNHNWNGGISPLAEKIRKHFKYRQWVSDIFTRDNFTCQECGQIGRKLNAHHIKSFSLIFQKYEITTLEEALECEELWNINNGITLCVKCHKDLHKLNKI